MSLEIPDMSGFELKNLNLITASLGPEKAFKKSHIVVRYTI